MLNYHRPMTETPFQLECDIPGADYRNPIVWLKDGKPIDLSNPSPRAPQPRDNGRLLVFRSMLLPHSGVYSCQVGPDERTDIVDVRPESVQGILIIMFFVTYIAIELAASHMVQWFRCFYIFILEHIEIFNQI